MAAFQQAGDFLVTPVNGEMVKNGGNVVSYFCTPEGRLIHAVGGPVDANRLLTEARWAKEVFTLMQADTRINKRDFLRQSHQMASGNATSAQGNSQVWKARISSDQKSVHRLMAQYAYSPMSEVETSLFRTLSGEKFESNRTVVLNAAQAFTNAKKRNRPVLLVLSSRRHTSPANRTPTNGGVMEHLPRSYQANRYLRKFSVVNVPRIQLAAFTNLQELTGWDKTQTGDTRGRFGDICLVVHSSGEILCQLDLHSNRDFCRTAEICLRTVGTNGKW